MVILIRSFPKTIRSLRIAKPYLAPFRAYIFGVILEKPTNEDKYKNKRETFYTSNNLGLQRNVLRSKTCLARSCYKRKFMKRRFFVNL